MSEEKATRLAARLPPFAAVAIAGKQSMAIIDDALVSWRARLAELDRAIAPLEAEAEELRAAIAMLEGRSVARGQGSGRGGCRTTRPAAPAATGSAGKTSRAPRGQNRARILAAVTAEAKTASDVARETGIQRATVSSTLTKLAGEGLVAKARRGYVAAAAAREK